MATPNTTFVSGSILTATQVNNLAWGNVGYASVTSALAGVTGGPSDLAGMSVTFTAVANRIYKATWKVTGSKNASGLDVSRVIFATSTGTQLSKTDVSSPSGVYSLNLSGSTVFTVAAGSVTYKLQMASFSGTFTPDNGATNPCVLVIEDIGAQ